MKKMSAAKSISKASSCRVRKARGAWEGEQKGLRARARVHVMCINAHHICREGTAACREGIAACMRVRGVGWALTDLELLDEHGKNPAEARQHLRAHVGVSVTHAQTCVHTGMPKRRYECSRGTAATACRQTTRQPRWVMNNLQTIGEVDQTSVAWVGSDVPRVHHQHARRRNRARKAQPCDVETTLRSTQQIWRLSAPVSPAEASLHALSTRILTGFEQVVDIWTARFAEAARLEAHAVIIALAARVAAHVLLEALPTHVARRAHGAENRAEEAQRVGARRAHHARVPLVLILEAGVVGIGAVIEACHRLRGRTEVDGFGRLLTSFQFVFFGEKKGGGGSQKKEGVMGRILPRASSPRTRDGRGARSGCGLSAASRLRGSGACQIAG